MFIYLPRSCRLRIQETPGIMCSLIVEGALFITPILFVRMCVCVDVKRTLLIIPIHFVRVCGDVKGALLLTPILFVRILVISPPTIVEPCRTVQASGA